MKFKRTETYVILLAATFLSILNACSSSKKEKKVAFMKDLTAHYNIYYNAAEMLQQSEVNFQNNISDDYSQLLNLFPSPNPEIAASETENLNEVINKANRIALEKYESNWVDDAFLLLAKAEYYKGNYYNAAEYFDYVAQTFPAETENVTEALIWKAKTFFALEEFDKADTALQEASKLKTKKHLGSLNAALANVRIQKKLYKEAIDYLIKGIENANNRYERVRRTYILAQLYELNSDAAKAIENYIKVAKSNAAFEMSFNANLSLIRLKENESGISFDKVATLERLLKEDKNQSFKDQIYYQIARTYQSTGNIGQAIVYYKKSAHSETDNNNQKAVAYQRMAELQFDSLKNYVQAQLYYDSTLQFISSDYPGYQTIELKAQNLQYLAEKLTIIQQQKELLYLAGLDIAERTNVINQRIQSQLSAADSIQNKISNPGYGSITEFSKSNETGGTFYFDNKLAISKGFNEFKTKWGNRKLEDNWRISAGVSAQNIAQNVNTGNLIENGVNKDLSTLTENIDSLRQKMLAEIPTSATQRQLAEQKIKNAKYDIALFYKDILKDNKAAIKALEDLLTEYTSNDPKVAELYYQLYRLNEIVNTNESYFYKQELIKKFPNSIFTKAIQNPDFGKENEARERKLKVRYGQTFKLYQDEKYERVISSTDSLKEEWNNFPVEGIRFSYLRALAIGHLYKAPAFVDELQGILEKYPNDSTLNPIIESQLAYIQKNRETFYQRPQALMTYDADLIRNQMAVESQIEYDIPPLENKEIEKLAAEEKQNSVIPDQKQPVTANKENTGLDKSEKPKAIAFTNNPRIKHAIVVDIRDSKKNIAKGFASITKYFYSKFVASNVAVNVRTFENDKLIIIKAGFNTYDSAVKALEALKPSLKELLELPDSAFRSFVISDPNLLLIKNSESLNQYLKFIE